MQMIGKEVNTEETLRIETGHMAEIEAEIEIIREGL